MKNKNLGFVLRGIFFLLIIGAALFVVKNPSHISTTSPTPTIVIDSPSPNTSIRYQGHDGQDALSLLKKQSEVELGSSGLVTAINGSKADDQKHEYWAFYVNGKMSQVGPAEYKSKDTDKIEWKIEKY